MSLAFLFAWLPSVIVNAYSLKHADKLKDLQWQFDPLVSKGCLHNKYAYWRILENSSMINFPLNIIFDFLLDKFSRNTVWLMTRKIEIQDNFLDEFSKIRQ